MDKTCSKCRKTKSLSCFYRQARGLNGVRAACKDCCQLLYEATDTSKAKKLKWLQDNKTKASVSSKRWREANKDKMRQIKTSWNERNPDKVAAIKAAYKHRYRLRCIENGNNDLTRQQIEDLFRDHPFCQYCNNTENLTLDHIIPVSRGGQNTLSNVTVACALCNSTKNNKAAFPNFGG